MRKVCFLNLWFKLGKKGVGRAGEGILGCAVIVGKPENMYWLKYIRVFALPIIDE